LWVDPFLPDFVGSGAKGSGGSWTRITSLHFYLLWLLFHYLLGDTRDRAGGRNVHIQSTAFFSLRVCSLAHWVPFISFLYIFPFCMFVKGQSVLIGVKEGDRETVFALGLHPGQRELGHLRSDSAG
jgi:hypothetical protein